MTKAEELENQINEMKLYERKWIGALSANVIKYPSGLGVHIYDGVDDTCSSSYFVPNQRKDSD